jgi:hypothetical protein
MPDLVIRPAVQDDRLYERLGFRDIPGSAAANRAGGISIGMARGADTHSEYWPKKTARN